MNTKLLRQKVLDLAIHGKLVPQNPEHEPASKLLERIRGESLPLASRVSKRNSVVSDSERTTSSPRGKAPKTPSAPISEDEIPFEIPENWCWCRLSDIAKIKTGSLDANAQCENGEYPFFTCGEEVFKTDTYAFDCSAVLLGGNNATGDFKMHICKGKFNAYQRVYVISPILYGELTEWCFLSIKNYLPKFKLDSIGSQTRYLKLGMISDMIIPLPPLEEQKLIVEEIERIFALIDTIEQNKTDLETVIKQTKSKILDLAIHGKLVPQDKTDEPASKMLEKLRAEKEEKIAKGQLKRDKNDSYIYKSADGKWLERKGDGSEEEIEVPFEIPESWSWCHAVDLYNIRSAIRIHKSDWKDKGIPFFRGRDLVELARTGNVHPEVFITEELYELNKSKGGVPQKDDILVSAVGTLGCVHIVEGTKKFYYKDAYILCFENIYNLNSKYVKYVIESDYTHDVIYDGSKGTTIDQLTIENAKALWIPFPPLDEQNRIVSMIDNSVQFLEKIKNQI